MEEKLANIILILGVGIAGIYISHIISPYISSGITKGLEVVSEKIITLPLPEEKETTKFVFFSLTGAIVFQLLISIIDVANGYSFFDAYMNSIDVAEPVINETIKFTSLTENIANDLRFLEDSKFVTNFYSDPYNLGNVAKLQSCLLLKYFNSSIIGPIEFFEQHLSLYEENLYRLQTIPNDELMRIAPHVRDFYVSKALGLEQYCTELLIKLGIDSEEEMILLLMEANARYCVSLGGVTLHELILRNVMGMQAYIENPNMFDAILRYDGMRVVSRKQLIDGIWVQSDVMVRNLRVIMNPSCPSLMMDGCIDPYLVDVYDYGSINIHGINMEDIIFKDKVMKTLFRYCSIF